MMGVLLAYSVVTEKEKEEMEVSPIKPDEQNNSMMMLNESTIEQPPPDSESIISMHEKINFGEMLSFI